MYLNDSSLPFDTGMCHDTRETVKSIMIFCKYPLFCVNIEMQPKHLPIINTFSMPLVFSSVYTNHGIISDDFIEIVVRII